MLVEPHDEQSVAGDTGLGHQEIRFVLDGSALHRGASALEPWTIVSAVGAPDAASLSRGSGRRR